MAESTLGMPQRARSIAKQVSAFASHLGCERARKHSGLDSCKCSISLDYLYDTYSLKQLKEHVFLTSFNLCNQFETYEIAKLKDDLQPAS